MKKEETKKFRARIIGAIEGTPGITAKELAVQLDVRQSNLYYHLKYLMNAKEVSVSIHQTQNGINEKYYFIDGERFFYEIDGKKLDIN